MMDRRRRFVAVLLVFLGMPVYRVTAEVASQPATIEEFLKDWELHYVPLRRGEIDWQLVSQKRSASYGSPLSMESRDSEPQRSVGIRFDEHAIQLTGTCEPCIRFGKPALPDASGWESNRQFLAVLNSRFSADQIQPTRYQTYSVEIDATGEIHRWPRSSTVGVAVIFAPGQTGTLQLYDSMQVSRLSLLLGLIEPLRLSLRPEFLFRSKQIIGSLRLLDHRPVTRGTSCLAVEFPLEGLQPEVTCRLWLNPEQGQTIVRILFLGAGNTILTRYDLEYDRHAGEGWIPREVTVLQFNSFGDVYDEIRARRTEVRWNPEFVLPRTPIDSAGWTIIDQAQGQQFQIDGDGKRRHVSLARALSPLSATPSTENGGFQRRMTMYSLQVVLLRMVTWPWILLTLTTGYCMWMLGRYVNWLPWKLRRRPKT